MLVSGLPYEEFSRITAEVSARRYASNVVVRDHSLASGSGKRFRVTLTVTDSAGAGSRRAASGRRGPWACWHAFRDVLIGVFTEFPDARVRTGLALYDSAAGFRENYPATGERNIGSQMLPVTMPECCACGGNEPMTHAEYRAAFEDAFAEHFSANRITPRGTEPASDATCPAVPAPGRYPDQTVFGPPGTTGKYLW